MSFETGHDRSCTRLITQVMVWRSRTSDGCYNNKEKLRVEIVSLSRYLQEPQISVAIVVNSFFF